MNLVDLHVKESMLQYASIFPTRLTVLRHAFFVLGNGYDWLENGTIGSHYEEPKRDLPEGIDVEHLNERIAKYEAEDTDFAKRKLVELKAEKAARLETFANIDTIAATVDPKGEIKDGHYGDLANILRDLEKTTYTGKPYLKIWNVPANVEPSWWAAANEAMEAAIRGSIYIDDREYACLCWNAMTDFVEGRAETFVVPVKPETRAERQARLSAKNDLRLAAFDESNRIVRILNRAGYSLNMKANQRDRNESDMSNGTFYMAVYKATALTDETITKIDRSMTKAGYTRTDNADLPTWENGKKHRVALRLFPFTEGLWKARILVITHPDDESGNHREKKCFARAQERFDCPDESAYVAPPKPAPVYNGPIHQVVPGSLEMNGSIIQAAVHTGASEWDVQNIRYVRADLSTITDKTRTMQSVLSEVYENSEGCLVRGGFKVRV